ncbi:MAG: LTA synthase family protein [Bacteroidales bacterium]|nr:LTA synthase family protein [Bacteroidales bacterium]
MLSRIIYLTKYFLYWLFFFFVLKFVFLIYFWRESFPLFSHWWEIYFHGLRLDISASGYLLLMPLIILFISVFINSVLFLRIIRIYTYIIIFLFSILAAADLGLYREWGFRMDYTPLLYLSKPDEAFSAVSYWYLLFHFIIGTALFTFFIYLFNRLFKNTVLVEEKKLMTSSLILLILGFMIIPIRGGIGGSPVSTASAYFNEISFLNHASVNLPWNVGFSILNMEIEQNPFTGISEKEADSYASDFTESSSVYQRVLEIEDPNIILIVLESFTANTVGCLGKSKQLTPNLDKLAKDGILFSNMYASGDRTDKGMLATMGGFPSQPTSSLIKYSDKTEHIPAIPKKLRSNDYSTYFYYGGNIEFANYKSYLINAGIEHIIEEKDFPSDQRSINWGVPDEFLLQRVAHDIKNIRPPFFITLFTLSSHTPYDSPVIPLVEGNNEEAKFCNSVHYTDLHIGRFIDSLKTMGILKNTLVIFIADHGSKLPGDLKYDDPGKFHIPMIWYGGALTLSDTIISTYCNQTDLAATLLPQLNINCDEFIFSKNILAEFVPDKTVFAFNNGVGFVSDSLIYNYYLTTKSFTVNKGTMTPKDSLSVIAFYQKVYNSILRSPLTKNKIEK